VRARFPVGEPVRNFLGSLHGGAIATAVDDVGTFAVMAADHYHRHGVTTDLHISYFRPGAPDDAILVEAKVSATGLTMAFVRVTLTSESRGEAIAQGQMTMLLVPPSAPTGPRA
jgi:acyl-coenzyme A thioesterase 13